MENYYEILKISNEADLKEIKKAYAKLLRQYPPERFPEEFKKIRKAYEVLSNLNSRKSYDAKMSNLNISNQKNEFQVKKNIYKSERDNSKRKNYFIFKNEENNNDEVQKFTPKNNYKEILKVIKEYQKVKNYKKIIEILNSTIDRENYRNSNNIVYYMILFDTYIILEDMNKLARMLDEFIDGIDFSKNDSFEDYVCNELKSLCIELYEKKNYMYSKIIARKILINRSDDKELKKLVRMLESINECEALRKDDTIADSIKKLVELWFVWNIDNDEKEAQINNIYDEVDLTDNNELKISIDRIKICYRKLYNIDPNFFDKLYRNINKYSPKRVNYKEVLIEMVVICIVLIAFLFIQTQKYTNRHNLSMPIATFKLPSELPDGYFFESGFINDDFITSSPESINLSAIENIRSFNLTYTDGTSKIYFCAYITSNKEFADKLSTKKLHSCIIGKDKETALYFKNHNATELLMKKTLKGRPMIISFKNKYNKKDKKRFVLYEITETDIDEAAKNRLIMVADNLK